MSYEEALLRYETNQRIQQENQSFKDAILTAQILEVEGAKRLEKALKPPPGSGAKEEYQEVCRKLAELTGQTMEGADEQIKRARDRINITYGLSFAMTKTGQDITLPLKEAEYSS